MKKEIITTKKSEVSINFENENEAKNKIIEMLKLGGLPERATNADIELFVQYAITAKLNPLKREIYFVPFNGKYQPITGYQVYWKRAWSSGKLDYLQPSFDKTDKGELICVIKIKRKDSTEPMEFKYYLNEHKGNSPIWSSKPRFMFEKVATVLTLRKVLADCDELQLPYTAEEMDYQTSDKIVEDVKEDLTDKVIEEIDENNFEFEMGE